MALVTVEILSLYSFAFKFPLLSLAFTMVKFDPAVVSAATLGNKRYNHKFVRSVPLRGGLAGRGQWHLRVRRCTAHDGSHEPQWA